MSNKNAMSTLYELFEMALILLLYYNTLLRSYFGLFSKYIETNMKTGKKRNKTNLQTRGPVARLFETIQSKARAFSHPGFSQYLITSSHHKIHSYVHKYLDFDEIFVIFSLYSTTMEFKFSRQDMTGL